MPIPEVQVLQQALNSLEASVQRNTSVDDGATVMLDTLGDLMRQNADNPAAIRALADAVTNRAGEIDMSSDRLAAAITANTPSA